MLRALHKQRVSDVPSILHLPYLPVLGCQSAVTSPHISKRAHITRLSAKQLMRLGSRLSIIFVSLCRSGNILAQRNKEAWATMARCQAGTPVREYKIFKEPWSCLTARPPPANDVGVRSGQMEDWESVLLVILVPRADPDGFTHTQISTGTWNNDNLKLSELMPQKKNKAWRMDDCLVRNYSSLIRQAFGERVTVRLLSSFISQGILR